MSPAEPLAMNDVLRPRCTELHLHHRGSVRPRSPSASLTELNLSILRSSESTTSTIRPPSHHAPEEPRMQRPPSILNIHTPSSSFAIIHSLSQESLDELYNKLSRKGNTEQYPPRVGPGWLKYEWNGSVWNLDDDSDYTIFAWRQQQEPEVATHPQDIEGVASSESGFGVASTSRVTLPPSSHPQPKAHTPTLHLQNPSDALPQPPGYCNPSFYIFREAAAQRNAQRPVVSAKAGGKAVKTRKHKKKDEEEDGVVPLKRDFEKFHSQNGVRTIMGSIGPVENVRMLLKMGHKHVYMSRKFAIKHGFIPPDAAPGNYGYGGLVSIGYWPITIQPSGSSPQAHPHLHPQSQPTAQRASTPPQTLHPGFLQADNTRTRSPSPLSYVSSPRMGGTGNLLDPPMLHPSASQFLGYRAPSPQAPSIAAKSITKSKAEADARSILTTPPSLGAKKLTHAERNRIVQNASTAPANGLHPVLLEVFLDEEPHFDVVLGRSFWEKRSVKVSNVDMTEVWCMDVPGGEKIECEVVVLKDGRGEIVTVT